MIWTSSDMVLEKYTPSNTTGAPINGSPDCPQGGGTLQITPSAAALLSESAITNEGVNEGAIIIIIVKVLGHADFKGGCAPDASAKVAE